MLIVISDAEMAWQRNILWVLFVQECISAVSLAILFYMYQRLSHMARYVNSILKIKTSYAISQQIFYFPGCVIPLAFIALNLVF